MARHGVPGGYESATKPFMRGSPREPACSHCNAHPKSEHRHSRRVRQVRHTDHGAELARRDDVELVGIWEPEAHVVVRAVLAEESRHASRTEWRQRRHMIGPATPIRADLEQPPVKQKLPLD